VLRGPKDNLEILAFKHPLAGCQLVKGTLEPGERVVDGALRELAEEAGLVGTVGSGASWSGPDIADGQLWHFVPVDAPPRPDRFEFLCADDGGHRFTFFWWPLRDVPGPDWHETFRPALGEIRARQM
jgi:8-oxo-dGTP pyrophosphatase MutT (NUDIX family)